MAVSAVIIATLPRLLRPKLVASVRRRPHMAARRRPIVPIAFFIDGLPDRPAQFLFEMSRLPPAEIAEFDAELMAGNVFRKT
jgi:hypothetical protein